MSAPTAYLEALRLLARRELSEAQLRTRLARRGHDPEAIDAAIGRLTDERALDDRRVAAAIARLESGVRRRGPTRVRHAIERAGIDRDTARAAVDEAFATVNSRALLEEALARRLRGARTVTDERAAGRLYRALVAQGFEPDQVRRLLSACRKGRS